MEIYGSDREGVQDGDGSALDCGFEIPDLQERRAGVLNKTGMCKKTKV